MTEREPNRAWDLLVKLFDLEVATRTQQTRVGKLVQELKQLKATPAQLVSAVATYRSRWPEIDCSPEAVLKHWGVLKANRSRSRDISNTSIFETRKRLLTFREEEQRCDDDKEAALAVGKPWPPKWVPQRNAEGEA